MAKSEPSVGRKEIILGLRVDVDTYKGTRLGVPNLCRVLAQHNIKASFFFSVGPDNMGRHLWRLLRPAFLWKMVRSKAASLYGCGILLRGTLWPGPVIGDKLGHLIRATAEAGHEIGLHAWDHQAWQAHIDRMDAESIHLALEQGFECLTRLVGHSPTCSAVPGWKCNDLVLKEKAKFPFRYNSDCRGTNVFLPVVDGCELAQPQIPVTLPTYDEIIGRDGITNDNYNDRLLALLDDNKLNVLTIHAEAEGIACAAMFEDFLTRALARGVTFASLGQLLDQSSNIRPAAVVAEQMPGREGWLACQAVSWTCGR